MLQHLPHALGRALRGVRPGPGALLSAAVTVPSSLILESPAFGAGGAIPVLHTADGPGLSPPLSWRGVPPGAAALLLVVEDADSPTPRPLVHAVVTGLPAWDGALPAGALPSPGHPGRDASAMGRNSSLKAKWLPPDPPPGHGPHRYVFQLLALTAPIPGTPGRSALRAALASGALAKGVLTATYERP